LRSQLGIAIDRGTRHPHGRPRGSRAAGQGGGWGRAGQEQRRHTVRRPALLELRDRRSSHVRRRRSAGARVGRDGLGWRIHQPSLRGSGRLGPPRRPRGRWRLRPARHRGRLRSRTHVRDAVRAFRFVRRRRSRQRR